MENSVWRTSTILGGSGGNAVEGTSSVERPASDLLYEVRREVLAAHHLLLLPLPALPDRHRAVRQPVPGLASATRARTPELLVFQMSSKAQDSKLSMARSMESSTTMDLEPTTISWISISVVP